jgi:lipopolysaccharide/colanic/teichoic acid biosynthesis glycosyltransferase
VIGKPAMKKYKLLKRIFDVVGSAILMLMLSPLFALSAALIWLLEGRPIFYCSKRVVSKNIEARIVKFRTMVADATSPKYKLEERFMRDGYLDIPLSCEVYTPIGRILERTQVVEMLQLWNVFLGQMSFIGNRPLPQRNLDLLEKTGCWKARFESPAGISGISQVVGKYDLSPEERLNLEKLYSKVYQEGNVFKCDLEIIYFTLRLLLTGKSMSLEYATKLLDDCL